MFFIFIFLIAKIAKIAFTNDYHYCNTTKLQKKKENTGPKTIGNCEVS